MDKRIIFAINKAKIIIYNFYLIKLTSFCLREIRCMNNMSQYMCTTYQTRFMSSFGKVDKKLIEIIRLVVSLDSKYS